MNEIMLQYPGLTFTGGQQFIWSPKYQTVFYDKREYETPRGKLALLHEIGHAELGHTQYHSDIHLLNMEVDAWIYARSRADEFHVTIDDAHIDHCLETYRIWLYKRSRCPQCEYHGVQVSSITYRCFMCRHVWEVAHNLSLQPHRMNCQHTLELADT